VLLHTSLSLSRWLLAKLGGLRPIRVVQDVSRDLCHESSARCVVPVVRPSCGGGSAETMYHLDLQCAGAPPALSETFPYLGSFC